MVEIVEMKKTKMTMMIDGWWSMIVLASRICIEKGKWWWGWWSRRRWWSRCALGGNDSRFSRTSNSFLWFPLSLPPIRYAAHCCICNYTFCIYICICIRICICVLICICSIGIFNFFLPPICATLQSMHFEAKFYQPLHSYADENNVSLDQFCRPSMYKNVLKKCRSRP